MKAISIVLVGSLNLSMNFWGSYNLVKARSCLAKYEKFRNSSRKCGRGAVDLYIFRVGGILRFPLTNQVIASI